MASTKRRYSKEEFARRGDDIYETTIRPHLKAEDEGKFAAIDIESGAYEMDEDDHMKLADTLCKFKGKVVLSGYPSGLYSRCYKEWNRIDKKIPNHAAQTKTKKIMTECLFLNF